MYAVILIVQRKGGIEKLSKEKGVAEVLESEPESDQKPNEVEL